MEAPQYHIHDHLVARCRQGDSRAQFELYNLYAQAMYNVAYRIVNDTDDARDVLQEAFISAFTKLDSYKGKAGFGAWLKAIVVNKALNLLRNRKSELLVDDEVSEPAEEPQEWPDMHWEVERIRQAIAKLPDGYRVVVSLYLLEGYDHQEIADILGISESTSKTQYLRGKQKIRQMLSKKSA